jgi:hypothetical protein
LSNNAALNWLSAVANDLRKFWHILFVGFYFEKKRYTRSANALFLNLFISADPRMPMPICLFFTISLKHYQAASLSIPLEIALL